MSKLYFPKDFLWGAGSSAFQVEGNITNNWSQWCEENAQRLAQKSQKEYGHLPSWKFIEKDASDPANYIPGHAAEFEKYFEADLDLAKELGHNAHRFSIEWSRVEPREGEFDPTAIEFYKKLVRAIKMRGMVPLVTLWWWTDPLWITKKGGWEKKETVTAFLRYVEKIAKEFQGEGISFWQPLNEPGVPIGMGYIQGTHPPGIQSLWRANTAFKNLMRAYREAYKIIHTHIPDAQVGISHYARYMLPENNRWWNKIIVKILDYYRNWRFLDTIAHNLDFIGIQYYRSNVISLNFFKRGLLGPIQEKDDFTSMTDMGWSIYPEGMYHILKRAAKYGKTIYISENGIADARDQYRTKWIQDNLFFVHKAIQEGVPVKGYFHWSLIDIFEWDKGFWPRFGLVAIDYATQKRTIRPSALIYAKICKENALEIEN